MATNSRRRFSAERRYANEVTPIVNAHEADAIDLPDDAAELLIDRERHLRSNMSEMRKASMANTVPAASDVIRTVGADPTPDDLVKAATALVDQSTAVDVYELALEAASRMVQSNDVAIGQWLSDNRGDVTAACNTAATALVTTVRDDILPELPDHDSVDEIAHRLARSGTADQLTALQSLNRDGIKFEMIWMAALAAREPDMPQVALNAIYFDNPPPTSSFLHTSNQRPNPYVLIQDTWLKLAPEDRLLAIARHDDGYGFRFPDSDAILASRTAADREAVRPKEDFFGTKVHVPEARK